MYHVDDVPTNTNWLPIKSQKQSNDMREVAHQTCLLNDIVAVHVLNPSLVSSANLHTYVPAVG